VVASVSCIYNLGSPLDYGKNILEIIEGQLIERTTIMSRLVDMQYTRNDFELKRGCFRVRGDTLFIWPADADFALELIFMDNLIESIRRFEPISGETVEQAEETNQHHPKRFTIFPAKHYQSGQDKQEGYEQIEADLKLRLVELKQAGKVIEAYRLAQRVQHDIDMMREVGFVNGIENYSRYFDGRNPGDPPFTLLDYFSYNAKQFHNGDYLTIIDESHITLPQLRGMYAGDQSRKKTLIDYGFRLPSALDNRPLQYPETKARLHQIIYASATPNEEELELSRPHVAEQLIRPTGLVDPDIEIRPTRGQVPDLLEEIKKKKASGQRTLVTTLTKKTAEALTEYLNENGKSIIKVQYLHADVHTLDRSDILDDLRAGEYDVLVGINLLREGLDLPEVGLVAILEADKEGFLRSRSSLIQTMGRAARHQEGQVIMYADTITKSMKAAIDEVKRRREVQLQYNKEHNITPLSIQKEIRNKLLIRQPEDTDIVTPKELKKYGWKKLSDINTDTLTPKDTKSMLKELTKLMKQSAKNWDFEQAAKYRDMIKRLQ
jgi:excinuclease ABC subunit B